jgi:LPS O-antigen subunit length determinant protein (WzzB/FepE family)
MTISFFALLLIMILGILILVVFAIINAVKKQTYKQSIGIKKIDNIEKKNVDSNTMNQLPRSRAPGYEVLLLE